MQVYPEQEDPADLFSNTPITVAASYFASGSPVEFVRDPSQIEWRREGWGVWYGPERPDAFLTSLHAIYGNRAYLLYSEHDYVWNLEGNVLFEHARWRSDSFNLVGFTLNSQAPPTFRQFFSGSSAHWPGRIYRLVGGKWSPVTDLDGTPMKSGEAYWVYCRGGSDYQGPLRVEIASGKGILFAQNDLSRVVVANASPDPTEISTQLVGGEVGLSYQVRALAPNSIQNLYLRLAAQQDLAQLEPGKSTSLTLQIRREEMTSSVGTALLKISNDIGVECWVPVVAHREDLSVNP